MKTVLIGLILLAARAWGAPPQGAKIFPKTAIALPAIEGVSVEWALGSEAGSAASGSGLRLAVDAEGRPWFAGGTGGVLIDPVGGGVVSVDRSFADFVWLPDGEPVACTKDAIGFLSPFDLGRPGATRPKVARFVPIAPLSFGNCRLFEGGGESVYLVERNTGDGSDEIYLLDASGGKPSVVKLASSARFIGAAAGDGRTTFVASGRWILKLEPGAKEVEWYFQARREITGLQYAGDGGLFYSTTEGVGFVGPDFQLQFLTAPNPEIALRGRDLYVRLGRGFDVLKIKNAARFGEVRRAQAKAP